jgi:hypothetical protein
MHSGMLESANLLGNIGLLVAKVFVVLCRFVHLTKALD